MQWRNPVMFVVYIGSLLTTALWLMSLGDATIAGTEGSGFILAVSLWLWFTVIFANFAEAMAEGRSKAQAASLRGLKSKTWAKKLGRSSAGPSQAGPRPLGGQADVPVGPGAPQRCSRLQLAPGAIG